MSFLEDEIGFFKVFIDLKLNFLSFLKKFLNSLKFKLTPSWI